MTSTVAAKSERINLRLKQSTKTLLERAASFEGKSVSSFILNSALAHAEETIHQHESIKLNAQDSEAFFNALSQPVQFNESLLDAMKEHERRVISK